MRLAVAICALVLMAAAFDSDASGRRATLSRSGASGSSAKHHHHHHRPRIYFLPTFWTQPRPYYYPAAPVTQYWYYCQGAAAYYPYVHECPGGWEPVIPSVPLR